MKSVVVIGIDTQRADRMSCYGYPLKTTPRIDEFAADAVRFEDCFATGIATHPVFTSIMTGLHPLRHKIVSVGGATELAADVRLLPGILWENGYTTVAVSSLTLRGWPRTASWFGRGYGYYVSRAVR